MKPRSRAGVTLAAALGAAVMLAAPVQAHHSFAMYDLSKTKVFTGVVTRIDPAPNHLAIFFAPMNAERKNVERDANGVRPAHIKERIRALGPTVRPDLTLKPGDPDAGNWVI